MGDWQGTNVKEAQKLIGASGYRMIVEDDLEVRGLPTHLG
jgi:hypothetical protein